MAGYYPGTRPHSPPIANAFAPQADSRTHRPRPAALKGQPGEGLLVGGVTLPLALAELGLIDAYEFVVHPRLAGHGPTLFTGLSTRIDLKFVSRLEYRFGAVAMRYEPKS